MGPPEFVFVTCQIGAEAALKAELARDRPTFRFAYSRPGFLTFKLPPDHGLHDTCELGAVFSRSAGFSLGKATGATVADRAASVWQLAGERPYSRLHVWQRTKWPVAGDETDSAREDNESADSTERSPTSLFPGGRAGTGEGAAEEAEQAILALWPTSGSSPTTSPLPQAPSPGIATRPGDLVLDCILIEPDQWWLGFHRAHDVPSCRPGGLFLDPLPPEAVSRAYLKMEEALAWSRLPVRRGDVCVEIGSAPGGSAQALLRRGARVIGIDPADMDERVLADPNFEHWKKRGADVRRREFRTVRWLTADMNVAPQYTLDTVEAIVTHESVHVAGLLLTLKLLDWSLAAEIPKYLDRIRSWGFKEVLARQLHHNRHEICVAALTPAGRRRQRPSNRERTPRPARDDLQSQQTDESSALGRHLGSAAGDEVRLKEPSEGKRMASGHTGNVVPGNRLRVRVPCPPLWRQAAVAGASRNQFAAWTPVLLPRQLNTSS